MCLKERYISATDPSGDPIENDVQFYNVDILPFVFQDVNDFEEIDEALEDRTGLYEEKDFDENEPDAEPF